jgi:hypothetical protein
MIRLDLITELNRNRARYLQLYGGKERFDYIMNELTPVTCGDGSASREKWMTVPDMIFLLTQRYKHVVALLTDKDKYSKTYFMLECEPTSAERLICLTWVNDNHFMVVRLKQVARYLRPVRRGWVIVVKMRLGG